MARRQDPIARTDDQRRRLTEEMRRLEQVDEETSSDAAERETGEPSEEELREARRRLEERN